MQVDIKEGGDGVACWNAEAITAYAAVVDAREAALASENNDLDPRESRSIPTGMSGSPMPCRTVCKFSLLKGSC